MQFLSNFGIIDSIHTWQLCQRNFTFYWAAAPQGIVTIRVLSEASEPWEGWRALCRKVVREGRL